MCDEKQGKDVLKIVGNHRKIPIMEYQDYEEDEEIFKMGFMYKDEVYFLDEIEKTNIKGYDGIYNFNYFSGILIKFCGEDEIEGPFVKVYYYY